MAQARPSKARTVKVRAGAEKELLSPVQRTLLSALFGSQGAEPTGVNAKRFRAQHDEHLSEISNLVSAGWVEEREGAYLVQLVGVAELATTDPAADSLMFLCNHIYNCLRRTYKEEQDKKLLLPELATLVDMPLGKVRRAIPYLRQASLFGGYSIDLAGPEAYVVLGEELIRYKSFQEIVDQHRTWAEQRTRGRWELEANPLGGGKRNTAPTKRAKTKRRKPSSGGRSRQVRTVLEVYTLGKQIGQGGSGYVLSALSEGGSTVALKYLDPSKSSATLLKRFRNEVRFGQRTNHPNIVPVLDVGEAEFRGRMTLFFTMPLYPLTLRAAMDRGLTPPQAIRIFEQLLAGVAAAHERGVWHRDLKPENVLLSADMKQVLIGDFGIAHFSEDELYAAAKTKAADRLANFQYAAPEQRDRRAEKDHRVDIFALGLMLNEMLTGEVPHGSDYRKIAEHHPTLAYLDTLVTMMTQQRPSDRPTSIALIQEHLQKSR